MSIKAVEAQPGDILDGDYAHLRREIIRVNIDTTGGRRWPVLLDFDDFTARGHTVDDMLLVERGE